MEQEGLYVNTNAQSGVLASSHRFISGKSMAYALVCFVFLPLNTSLGQTTPNHLLVSDFGKIVMHLDGDAFFPARLLEKAVDMPANSPLVFYHINVPGSAFSLACTYGTTSVSVTGRVDVIRSQLSCVYSAIRNSNPKIVQINKAPGGEVVYSEKNGPVILIYDKDFDYTNCRLGLKYNPGWWTCSVEEMDPNGILVDDSSLPYLNLTGTNKHTIEEWKYAGKLPYINIMRTSRWSRGDHVSIGWRGEVSSSDCIFIVLCPPHNLADFADRKIGAKLYVVEEQSIREYEFSRKGKRTLLIPTNTSSLDY